MSKSNPRVLRVLLRGASLATATAAATAAALAACGTGGVATDPPMDELPDYIDCLADLSMTGSFVPPGEPPAPDAGCVAEGTWTVSVAVADAGTCSTVPVVSSYLFDVVRDGGGTLSATYAAQGDQHFAFSVSSNTGDCKADFQLAAADGLSLIILRPLETEGVISGSGSYEHYSESQNRE